MEIIVEDTNDNLNNLISGHQGIILKWAILFLFYIPEWLF